MVRDKYNYDLKASELGETIQKAIKCGGVDIVQIRINGEYYNIINDLERLNNE